MDKYSQRKYSPNQTQVTTSRSRRQYDSGRSPERSQEIVDPYLPVIVEDLLHGNSDWKNINDIVKITVKQLTDVVRAQGETLRELERQLPNRASKTDVNSGLALKANISDVSRTIAEVAGQLEGKLSFEDLQLQLKDFLLKTEFQYNLANKVSHDELKSQMENKVDFLEFRQEFNFFKKQQDEFEREIRQKIEIENISFRKEFEALHDLCSKKADKNQIMELLDQKANKNSVQNALHRKANKQDVEEQLSKKIDSTDLKLIFTKIDEKVDFQEMEKIMAKQNEFISQKCNKKDLDIVIDHLDNKLEASEFTIFQQSHLQMLKLCEQGLLDKQAQIDRITRYSDDSRLELHNLIQKKIESKDLDRFLNQLSQKVDGDLMEATVSQLKNEVYEDMLTLKSDFNKLKSKQECESREAMVSLDKIDHYINKELQTQDEQIKKLVSERKNDFEESSQFIKGLTDNLKQEFDNEIQNILDNLDQLRINTRSLEASKLSYTEFERDLQNILKKLEDKVDLNEVQSALNACQQETSNRFVEYKDEFKSVLRAQENSIFIILDKKVNIQELNHQLQQKCDTSLVQQLLAQKTGFQEVDDLRKNISKVSNALDQKLQINDFERNYEQLRSTIEITQKDLLLKANIKDLLTLIDTKANVDDINKAFQEQFKQIQLKAFQEDLNNIVNDQATINESLCTENIVGRWTWKSGETKQGAQVPWEIQVVNTLPDNYLWEKDKTSILIVAPGLYELSFGFYAKKKPTIQILINSEPIISKMPSTNSTTVKENKHSSGNITGVSMIDYIVIPARARLSVSYTGEYGAEGFLGLRRL